MNRVAALPLTDEQRATLARWVRAGTTPQRLVFRSRIVLLAARGMPSKHVARQLETSQDTVRLWRRRCAAGGPDALRRDAPGRGRKRQITAAREQQVVEATLHRAPPRATQWSLRSMAATQGLSPASIHRIWVAHGLQPHRVRTFKLSTDPAFVEKLTDVVGLYVNPPDKALVVCVDEKSQIQALQRSQPGLPLKPGRAGTMTHDYQRHGTTTLFAALNVLDGTVIGSCHARHRHQEFRTCLNVLDADTPADIDVHAIVDNYATHKHPAIQRWLQRHPRFHLHFIPTSGVIGVRLQDVAGRGSRDRQPHRAVQLHAVDLKEQLRTCSGVSVGASSSMSDRTPTGQDGTTYKVLIGRDSAALAAIIGLWNPRAS